MEMSGERCALVLFVAVQFRLGARVVGTDIRAQRGCEMRNCQFQGLEAESSGLSFCLPVHKTGHELSTIMHVP
jgi:hypothetical protein